jgi:hypothetical protein
VLCHPNEVRLLDALAESAVQHPNSGYLMGHAVYALTKFGYEDDAADLVELCEAEDWWCDALRGFVLHSTEQAVEAEALFRRAMNGAPDGVRCSYENALWLLGDWDQRTSGIEALPDGRERTSEWSCARSLAASDSIWWWADPLYSVEGNDRWTEHIARAMSAQFYADIRRARRRSEVPRRFQEHDWAMRVRRGPWDSYDRPLGRDSARLWTSQESAEYHFVPELDPGDLSNPTWRIVGDLQDEGYTPDYGPLVPIPVQMARFRSEGSLRIALAGSLAGTRLERAPRGTAHFLLTDGPERFPLHLVAEVSREPPRFLGTAPAQEYVAAFELSTRIGTAWDRRAISPLKTLGPEISDLLFYDPSERGEPDSLMAAAAAMLGSATADRTVGLGVFWETYGVPHETTLEFEVAVERASGGLVDRITRLLPGGERLGLGQIRWTEPSSAETHSKAVALDLTELDPGEYTVVIRVRWPGQGALEARRRVMVG